MRAIFVSARLPAAADLALLLLRLVLGAAFVIHGYSKFHDPTGWATRMLPGVPAWLQAIAAFAELGGGAALMLGLFTRLFAFLIACNMVVAVFGVLIPHHALFVNDGPGAPSYEKPLVYLAVVLALLLCGPGRFSADAALFAKGRRK
jgi:putative oxidoreductase